MHLIFVEKETCEHIIVYDGEEGTYIETDNSFSIVDLDFINRHYTFVDFLE